MNIYLQEEIINFNKACPQGGLSTKGVSNQKIEPLEGNLKLNISEEYKWFLSHFSQRIVWI